MESHHHLDQKPYVASHLGHYIQTSQKPHYYHLKIFTMWFPCNLISLISHYFLTSYQTICVTPVTKRAS